MLAWFLSDVVPLFTLVLFFKPFSCYSPLCWQLQQINSSRSTVFNRLLQNWKLSLTHHQRDCHTFSQITTTECGRLRLYFNANCKRHSISIFIAYTQTHIVQKDTHKCQASQRKRQNRKSEERASYRTYRFQRACAERRWREFSCLNYDAF